MRYLHPPTLRSQVQALTARAPPGSRLSGTARSAPFRRCHASGRRRLADVRLASTNGVFALREWRRPVALRRAGACVVQERITLYTVYQTP